MGVFEVIIVYQMGCVGIIQGITVFLIIYFSYWSYAQVQKFLKGGLKYYVNVKAFSHYFLCI